MSRLSTAVPGKRRGYLVLNSGGPALAGLAMPTQMASVLPREVLDAYDLIGFDPRGVGHSTPQSWGQSYGTYLGAVYASLFPWHTYRMILEGNVDPARVWQRQWQS
ncbi:alpha/beta fold hydrolase [Actinoplanes sp. NBRC 103695]|uniref:alpha/beta fold hydrolase n=1 Tax=Actinoplanes sp. NBRC 103695 TaxID=3032202 RepID=UPI0025521000|nr:alpha/beta fold hydrolase [Actinoplanes sp. NBRC 103695]